ncbi:hypothetical protein [Branchiibius sp. NY16-3462-2]|uniref:Uncharacterized protein n=1 Tax=Branchiibius cervicis TaxID=908252 RepID=A0ABW2AV69_9MICO|nr:hypothetical protein [Branchiibius sp. NY16-3462-2]KYH43892.1 hypothetical protein AZH51_15780 [Branchiibius sp. NY16-3462-2]
MTTPTQMRFVGGVAAFAVAGAVGSLVPHGWGLVAWLAAALAAVIGAWALRPPVSPQRALWGALLVLGVCAPMVAVPVALLALPASSTGLLGRFPR